jgi:SAM-dependent methyltransferase
MEQVHAAARDLLRRKLPPKAFEYARSCWWYCRLCLPRLSRRSPRVCCFPSGQTSELQRLRGVNLLAPTRMCYVMTKYGSDKGNGWHNYTTIYSALFRKLSKRPIQILEIGLGTNNPSISSHMFGNGHPGGSLRGWRELFPHARVFGADIDRDILFEENRIKTFYCDQLDGLAIRDLWSQPALRGGMDIIIDDGLHTFGANASFLEASLEHLRPGGFYIIEDVISEVIEQWRDRLEMVYSRRFPGHEWALVELPNATNNYDNNMVIIRRSADPLERSGRPASAHLISKDARGVPNVTLTKEIAGVARKA